ncbi:MAG TPA: Rieske (2Fe-2S) protein [Mycobacteriales bacterium]|jgi:nitrite reductase/ring-hydroxylating ferredoxin subunit
MTTSTDHDLAVPGAATPAGSRGAAVSRRGVLCGALLLGAAGAGALAGCGAGAATGTSSTGTTASPGRPGTVLAKLADVPVGGGIVVRTPNGQALVVVQPQAGTVKAFDARCTHQGAQVQAPQGGIMTCPLHHSQFRATDGSVVSGPAGTPLGEIAVTVQGQDVTLA